jgi:hypothetical protein
MLQSSTQLNAILNPVYAIFNSLKLNAIYTGQSWKRRVKLSSTQFLLQKNSTDTCPLKVAETW